MQYNKETFEQWWNYLKLSENYRFICELVSTYRESNDEFPLEKILEAFQNDEYFRPIEKYMKLIAVYEKFGDVHHNDFENWWGKYNQPKSVMTQTELEIYKEKKYERLNSALRTKNKTLEKYVNIWGKIIFSPNLYTKIERYVNLNRPMKDIESEMLRTIKKLKKEAEKNNREAIKERNEYFRVLYLSKQEGLTMSEIIKKIGSKEEKRFVKRGSSNIETPDPDTLRSYRRKKSKAELILKNVEQGFFPSGDTLVLRKINISE